MKALLLAALALVARAATTERMHTWDFTVTKDGEIWSFDTYGDIAPQDAH